MKSRNHIKWLLYCLVVCSLLSGCAHDDTIVYPELAEYLNTDRITITESTDGRVFTSLEMVTELTPYAKAESFSYNTAPLFTISDDEVYLIRNFPAYVDTTDEVLAFAENREWLTDIEVYSKDNFSEPIRIIHTEGLAGMIFSDIHCGTDGNLTIVGYMNDAYFLRVLDVDGNLLHTADFSDLAAGHINIPFAGDGIFCFINESNNDLYMLEPESDECKCIAENVLAYDVCGDDIYYITKGYSESYEYAMQLYSVNPAVSENTLIGEILTTDHVDSIVYDPGNMILYLAGLKEIHAYSLRDNTKTSVLSALDSSISLIEMNNDRLFVGNDYHQILVYEAPVVPQEIQVQKYTINVCDFVGHPDQVTSRFAPVLRAMQKDGLHVELNTVYYSPDSAEYNNTMAKKILANDTDFDLFYLADYMPDLFEEQICSDLTEYPLLEAYYDRMHPAVREICTIGRTAALFPMDLYQYIMIRNDSALISDIPEPPAVLPELKAFCDTAELALADGAWFTTASNVRALADPWLDQLASNYMQGYVTDEDALSDLKMLFETVLELIRKDSVKIGLNIRGEQYLTFEKCWLLPNDMEEERMYDLPKVNSEYRDCVGGSYYAVNANAQNKDITALLLAYYMEYYGELPIYSGDAANDTETEMFDRLQDCVRRVELPGFAEDMYYRFTDMASGKLTPEAAAEETFRYLKMIRDE